MATERTNCCIHCGRRVWSEPGDDRLTVCCSNGDYGDGEDAMHEDPECTDCCTTHAKPKWIALVGNLSSGFAARGPYKTEEAAVKDNAGASVLPLTTRWKR